MNLPLSDDPLEQAREIFRLINRLHPNTIYHATIEAWLDRHQNAAANPSAVCDAAHAPHVGAAAPGGPTDHHSAPGASPQSEALATLREHTPKAAQDALMETDGMGMI